MHSIHTAVVGAGFIGPVHVEALRRNGVTITGILGCNEEESKSACASLGLPRAYKDYDEVLSDEKVQVVHLAVPNILHYSMSKKALEAGKHVMCEKPLAMNSTESAELAKLAGEKKLAAGVCYNCRFYPINLHVKEMIKNGELGDILAVTGSYVQDWLLYDTDYNWRVLADQGGELRSVSDIGTHWMDLVSNITGLKVSSLLADLNTVHKVRHRPLGEVKTFTGGDDKPVETEPVDITTDDFSAIIFKYNNGARGVLHTSQITAGRKNCLRYEISGSKCSVAWNAERPNELWIGYRDKPSELLLRDPALLRPAAAHFSSYPGGHNEGFPDAFKQSFKCFYEYILAGDMGAERLYPTFDDGHHEIVLCDAILDSHKKQAWVNI